MRAFLRLAVGVVTEKDYTFWRSGRGFWGAISWSRRKKLIPLTEKDYTFLSKKGWKPA